MVSNMSEDIVVNKLENLLSLDELNKLSRELYNHYHTIDAKQTVDSLFNSTLFNFFNINISNEINSRKICNELINKYYHNEITIKSNFINNILLKTKNHITIFELNAGKSRLDLCKVNGSSIAYEIKTDLDNLNRLNKQLGDYLKLFEKVYIICSKKRCETIEKCLPNECGIYSYRITKKGKYIFKEIKSAKHSTKLDSRKQLELLTKKELESIVNKKYCSRNVLIDYILLKYANNEINDIFKKMLKSKYANQWNFLQSKQQNIYEIDYQWFFKNNLDPNIIYK